MHFRVIDERPTALPRHGASRLLLGFAALSILIHGLLFVPGGEAPLRLQPLGAPYIRVLLNPEPTPAGGEEAAHGAKPPKVRTPASPQPKSARETLTHDDTGTPAPQRPARPARTSASTTPRPASRPQRPTPAASTSATSQGTGEVKTRHTAMPAKPGGEGGTKTDARAQRNFLLGQLQDQLSRYLSYPLRARRRGWEGEVLLGLRLAADGRLSDIQLLRSSGHAALDRSALQALARMGRLHLPADAPPLQPTRLQLPVIYRLSES